MKRIFPLPWLLLLIWMLSAAQPAWSAEQVSIGVLAFRDKAATAKKWQPLATYLERSLPGYHFTLQAYTYEELTAATNRRQVDFVLSHAANYLTLNEDNSLSSPLATLIEREHDQPLPVYGGVIAVRASRADIAQLKDLKGKTIATSTTQGFGSYQIQAYELQKAGLNIPDDIRLLQTGLPVDRALIAVLEGRADAVFVRSGVVEQMMQEGKLDLKQLKIINPQNLPNFGYALSTALYPQWPFVAMPQVSDSLASRVAAALLNLPHDGAVARALGIWGFSIPANYTPVKDVMQALRVAPYDEAPEFSWYDVWQRYTLFIVIIVAAASCIVLLAFWLALSLRRLAAEQKKVQRSSRYARSLIEASLDPLVTISIEGKILDVNAATETITGMPRARLIGTDFADYFTEPEQARAGYQRVFAEGNVKDYPLTLRSASGRITEVLYNATLYRNEAGEVAGVFAAARDITERKQAEETLRRWAHVFEFAEWGTVVGSADGKRVELVNPCFARMHGYTVEETLRLPIPELFAPEARTALPGQIQIAHEKGHHAFESKHLRRDGSTFPVWVDVTAIKDEQGKVLYRVVNVQDISERKKTEAELEQYRQHLEELVTVRTAELAKMRDAAEAANRAKSVFLANMSHELRTPLNAILGFAQLLRRDSNLPKEAKQNLEIIDHSGQHLLTLINDVLEISRIEAGRTVMQNESFDLADTLTAISDMIRLRAEHKGLAFAVERIGMLPRYVQGDAPHLRQVLINLLNNAVKYTDQGKVVLRIVPTGDQITFAVIDTGIGISKEDQQRIFTAFYQTAAGAAKGEGAGLGLTVSREFVRLMGGEISLISEPGYGSTFSFALSLPESDTPSIAPRQCQVVGLAENQPPVRVLVVEDNTDSRTLLTKLLENVGFEVRAAENGMEAIEIFQAWQPHFIWMDMRMPVLDGFEATRRIRSLPHGQEVKIVALTASAFKEQRGEILAAGCDDMVSKPLDETRLFQIMGELLQIEYRCAKATAASEEGGKPTAAADLSVLDQGLRRELAQTAEQLDGNATLALCDKIADKHPHEAQAIREWVASFRFDLLLAALNVTTDSPK